MLDIHQKRMYPSEYNTEDIRCLQTQVRVFKRWVNVLLKQANAKEINDVLEIFTDHENLYNLCKYLASQKVTCSKQTFADHIPHLERVIAILEKLYGNEIATVIQTTISEFTHSSTIDSEKLLKEYSPSSRTAVHTLLLLGLDTLWILIVAIRAGTGPSTNLVGSISSSGSTITKKCQSIASSGHSAPAALVSTRSPCVDRWLISQDKRLLAWCIAVTEGYPGISLTNFTHSWCDGLAFLAIAHQIRSELFTFESRLEKTPNQNLSLAFHLATAEFATPRLLEPVDMRPENADARSTAVYLLELRKAVERDRKRRSRGILEIQTSAMIHGQSNEEPNVTVESRCSPTSTCSTSETSWLDDEIGDSDDETGSDINHLPDPDHFATVIETTLAWLLAMEEQFMQNDLHEETRNYTGNNCTTNKNDQLQLAHNEEDKHFILRLQRANSNEAKLMHAAILKNIDDARDKFKTHEDLTAHLSRRQMAVGRCLRLGNRLIKTHENLENILKNNITLDQSELNSTQSGSDASAGEENAENVEDKQRQLLTQQKLRELDPVVIQRQTVLLATRWNNLCRLNTTVGKRITASLLRRQTMLLSAIRIQLDKLENEQITQSNQQIGPSIADVKRQLEANRHLEQLIESGEALAERLDNFVTIVPHKTTDSEEKYVNERGIENTIAELATRWSRLVGWVNTRYACLQNVLLYWRHFEEEASVLSDWLDERTDEVTRVVASLIPSVPNHHHSGNLLTTSHSRHNSLGNEIDLNEQKLKSYKLLERTGSSGSSLMQTQDSMERITISKDNLNRDSLQQMFISQNNTEMEAIDACLSPHESRWAQLLASLDRRAQAIREACGDTESVSHLVEKVVDQLVSRWSQLRDPQINCEDWPEKDIKDIENYVESTTKTSLLNSIPNNSLRYQQNSQSEVKRTTDGGHLSLPKATKISRFDMQPPPSPTGYRAEFETKAEELLNWLDNSAEILELITMARRRALEASGQTLALNSRAKSTNSDENDDDDDDDAVKVINRVSKEREDWRYTKQRVLLLGEQYREELSQAGENIEELDQLFDEIEERWSYLDKLLIEANRQVRISNQSVEFQQEAAKIQALLAQSNEEELKLKNEEKSQVNEFESVTNEIKSQPNTEKEIDGAIINKKIEDIRLIITQVKDSISQPINISNPEDADEQLNNLNKMIKDFEATTHFLVDWEINSSSPSEGICTKWNETLQDLREQYETVCTELNARVNFLQDLSEQHELFLNQFEGIEKWLSDMTDYLDSVSRAHLPSVPVIQAQLQESCEALNDMKTLKPTLQKVDEVAHRLLEYFSPAYAELIANRLQSLHNDWNEVRTLTKSNRDQLRAKLAEANSSAILNRNQEFSGTTILSNLSSSATVLTDTHTTTCKADSVDHLALINTTSTTSNTNNNYSTLLSTSANEFPTINSLTTLSSTTTPSTPTVTATSMPNTVQVDIEKLEIWMCQSKEQLSQFSLINDPNDLKNLENIIKVIGDKITENRPILAAIDTCSAVNLAGQSILDTEALLTKAHFADLESAVAAERERLMAAIYHLDDFKTVLNSEKRWFETVRTHNERVKSSNYSEISEITDDLESLDRLSREHTIDDEERLNKLANSLNESHVMSSAIMKELEKYKTELTSVKVEVDSTTDYLQNLLSHLRSVDERVVEVENSLLNIEDDLDDYFFNTQSKSDICILRDKLQTRLKHAKNLIKELDEMIEYKSLQPRTDCLTNRLETYKAQLQERVEPLSKILPQLSNPSVNQSIANKISMELKQIESKLNTLDVVSVDPEDIKAAVNNGRTMFGTLNELKTDLLSIMDANDSLYINDRISSECLKMLSEKHNHLAMEILSALERLDKALPLIEELEILMSQVNENLLSVEEVTDYLETADCPVSRKDLIQKVYLQLTHLCQENGTVGQVKQITNKLKLLTPPDKPELTTELFNEIEDHLNKVIMSKDIFQSQMDELEKNTKHNELLETPENQLKLRNLHTPEFIDKLVTEVYSNSLIHKPTSDYLLSINRLTDNLLKPGTKISSTLQNLAREIRIHFNGLINFNYYCLGSGTQLADSSLADNEHNTNNPPIETSISERKTLLQTYFKFTESLFAQQRLYLETRLRDLIVTGGNDNSSDKLEDLLNLQSLWYETNEKLDKKFHGANLLEKKLIIAQQLLIDYTTTPTIELYDQCIKMITELEHTYGWKLTFDRERLKHRDYVDMSLNDLKNKFITGDPILNEGLLNVYEKQLQCTSRLLNCIQNDLEYCRDGLTSHLGAYMNTLEGELQSCNKSLTDSARILQEINDDIKLKRKNQTNQTYSANLENVNVIAQDNDEMIWLKVLLSTQKSRLDAYINEYELNRNDWFKRYELWQSFNEHLKDLKMTTNYLLTLQNENNQIELSNIENKIKDTCLEFNILRQHSSKLMSMNSTRIKAPVKQHSLPSSCNVFSTLTTSTLTTTASTITSFNSSNIDDKPPSVPPRRHSLYRGHGIQLIEHDHEFVRYELNRLENELLSLCRKYGTLNYVTQPLTLQTSNSFVHPEKSTNQSNQSQQTATNNEQSTENHINSGNNKPSGLVFSVKEIPVNFDNSSTSSMNTSKEHSLKGMQQQMIQSSDDIRTCLIGLNESIDWFIHESCLVPVNISDYIDRGKSFDYYMNESFWCTKSQTNQISVNNSINTSNGANEKLIEVNNTYVQLKLKELDNIEWKSMDWKNCINIFNDKSKILLKSKSLLNSNKELSKLEMINSKAQTILNLALNNLRKYREILYTFKTNLAKIEGSIRQIELIKNSIDDSDQIIQDLSINKWLKSLCQQITPHNSKRDGVATNEFIKELDPQYGKLGIQLILLGNLWNNAENHLDDLNKTVHNSMKFVYSASIENYVKEILNEWNNLSDTLQLTLTSSEFISSSSPTTKSENISRPIYSQDIFTKQTNNYDQNNDISLNSKALLENSVGNQRIKSLNESISSSGFLTNLLNDPCATTKETEIFESQSGPVVSNPTEANSIISTAICHESVLPLLNRMRSEVQQLTRWLTTIKNVLETSQAKLGDRFDQDTESQQLQQIKQAVIDGILTENLVIYHPATIQLKIKQFLTELEARKPQIERIHYEKERLLSWITRNSLVEELATQISRLLSGFAQAIIELVEDETTTPVTTSTCNTITSNLRTNNSTANVSSNINPLVKSANVNDNISKIGLGSNYYQSTIQCKTTYPIKKQPCMDVNLSTNHTYSQQHQQQTLPISSFSSPALTHCDSVTINTYQNPFSHLMIDNSKNNKTNLISANDIYTEDVTENVTDNRHEGDDGDDDNNFNNKRSLEIDTDHIQEKMSHDTTDTDTDSCLTEPQISPNYCHVVDKRFSLDEYELSTFNSSSGLQMNAEVEEISRSCIQKNNEKENEIGTISNNQNNDLIKSMKSESIRDSFTVDQLQNQWNTIEQQMIKRSEHLDQMLSATQNLKELQRDVEREISKTEADLQSINVSNNQENEQNLSTSRLLMMSPETCRKHLQELIDSLPQRSAKIIMYQNECEALIKQFHTEDTSRIRDDMEQSVKRWNELEKLINKTKTLHIKETPTPVYDHFKEQQTKLKDRRTSSSDGIRKLTLNEQLEIIEKKFNQISKLETELNQNGLQMDVQLLNEKRAHLVTESQTLQAEINMIATQIASSAKSSAQALNVLPNQEFFRRLRQLRDKIASLRRTMQSNLSQSTLYLNKLKKLNDWLSHRDAAFREILVPIQGDLGNVINLREQLLGLFQELNINRLQIEEVLCHNNAHYDNKEQPELNLSTERESEAESEVSDQECQNNVNKTSHGHEHKLMSTEDRSIRTNRRIRRHLYHLKKKWLNLNNNMLDFKCQLDGIWERLSNFTSVLNDAVAQVKSAESVTLKWIPIEFLPSEHIKTELDQTKSFYEACEPLAHSLDSLERQVLQLQEIQVQIEPKLRVQLNSIRNDFEKIRVITQTRIHQLNQSLSALQMMPQRPKYQTVTRNSSQRTHISRQEAVEPIDQTIPETSEQSKKVPLHDSVRLPWERCVHPSGSQVPYYKNHETQDTQWDHPILCDLMKSMKQFNTVRFSDYRTGLKLRRLQKELCLDSISISIIAENLKHIGHSQTLSNPMLGQQITDPFDRMINVPQIIDYLLQLFNHTRTLYGLNNTNSNCNNQTSRNDNSYGHNHEVDGDNLRKNDTCEFDANFKNEHYSTVPGSRPSDFDLKTSTLQSQNHSKNCMGSFLRSSSTSRTGKTLSEHEDNRKMTKTPVRDPGCHTIQNENTLCEDNRSSSLPVCTIMQVNNNNDFNNNSNNKDMNSINRGQRNTMRRRKHYLIGSIKRPVNVCVDLILNWLLNVYDRMRCGTIRVLSFKVALAIMSMANLDEKYRYLFSLISDRDGCVDEQRLGALLYECALIPRNLGETGQFGSEDFNHCVKTCFQQVLEISRHSDKIDGTLTYHSKPSARIAHFLTWLRLNPQMLTWLPLLHRLALSEQVIHHIRCSVCHNQPLIGLRYRCLRCLNFDMCQQCFFAGRTSRNHKLTHPMQEYCSHSTSTDSFKDFTRIVRNRFRSRVRLNDESERHRISTNGQKVRRSSTSRTRCKRHSFNSFDEDKPRPAPNYSQDPYYDFTEYQNLDTPFNNDSYRNLTSNTHSPQHYFISETDNNISNMKQHSSISSRPVSNVAIPTSHYSVPPRASSDTQSSIARQKHLNTNLFPTQLTASTTPSPQPLQYLGTRLKPDLGYNCDQNGESIVNTRQYHEDNEEHKLIARYSQELRQYSEPELPHIPPTSVLQSMSCSTGPMVMERSTISDSIPNNALSMDVEQTQPYISGHLSLDRRQMDRGIGFSSTGFGNPALRGSFSGWTPRALNGTSRVDNHYGPTGHFGQISYQNPIRQDINPDMYTHHIQRTFSLRARSQPPPEVQETMWKPIGSTNLLSRSPAYLTNYPIQQLQHQPYVQIQQTVQSLEDEHRALQYEYDRLRQKSATPTNNISGSYGTMNRLQYSQQRINARIPHQNPLLYPQPFQSTEMGRVNTMQRTITPINSSCRTQSIGSGHFSSSPLHSNIVPMSENNTPGRINSSSHDLRYANDQYSKDFSPTAYRYQGNMNDAIIIGGVSNEAHQESRLLWEHKGRLEARMVMLEEHNRQLEQQLQRLRQYLVSGNSVSDGIALNNTNSTEEYVHGRSGNENHVSLRQRSSSGGNNKNGSKNCSGSVGQLSGTFNEPNQFYNSTRHVTQRSYSERSAENHMQSLSHPRDDNISTDVPQQKSELKQ